MREPFGVETLRPWGPSGHPIFRDNNKLLFEFLLESYQKAVGKSTNSLIKQ